MIPQGCSVAEYLARSSEAFEHLGLGRVDAAELSARLPFRNLAGEAHLYTNAHSGARFLFAMVDSGIPLSPGSPHTYRAPYVCGRIISD